MNKSRSTRAPKKAMRRKTAKISISREHPNALSTTTWSTSGIVSDMYNHFQMHGYYRNEDLKRVLGDSTKSVEIEASIAATSALKRNLKVV